MASKSYFLRYHICWESQQAIFFSINFFFFFFFGKLLPQENWVKNPNWYLRKNADPHVRAWPTPSLRNQVTWRSTRVWPRNLIFNPIWINLVTKCSVNLTFFEKNVKKIIWVNFKGSTPPPHIFFSWTRCFFYHLDPITEPKKTQKYFFAS